MADAWEAELATLQPVASRHAAASARVANRLLEASDRNYWQPDEETLA